MRGKNLLLVMLFFASTAFSQYRGMEEEMPARAQIGSLLKQGKWAQAEGMIRQEMVRDTSDYYKKLLSWALIEYGAMISEKNPNLAKGKFEDAEAILKGVLQRDSNDEGGYWYLAMAAGKLDQYDKTLSLYKRYIEKARLRAQKTNGSEVENPKAWLHMGAVIRRKMHGQGITDKEWIEMVYDFEVYLRMNPEDPYAFNLQDFVDRVRLKRPEPTGVLVWDEKS